MEPYQPFYFYILPMLLLVGLLAPPVTGFAYIRVDADRCGQPGWLWALSTVFLSWVAVLAYLVMRSLATARPPRRLY